MNVLVSMPKGPQRAFCSPPGERQTGLPTAILRWATPEHSSILPHELWLPDSRMEKNACVLVASHPDHVMVASRTERDSEDALSLEGREGFTALLSWYEIVRFVLTEPGDHFQYSWHPLNTAWGSVRNCLQEVAEQRPWFPCPLYRQPCYSPREQKRRFLTQVVWQCPRTASARGYKQHRPLLIP